MARTAVYSTVYPGCEAYLAAWYRSLRNQRDTGFDIWLGADSITRGAVEAAVGAPVDAAFVPAASSESPAALRRRCLAHLCRQYDLVILLDCDDEAEPGRVGAAKERAAVWSVSVCALELVDAQGRVIGRRVTIEEPVDWPRLLPFCNVVGMSNAAYDASLLRELLGFPDDCVLVDWYLATRAWLLGAAIHWEPRPLVRYRQHGANTAAIVPPFTAEYIRRATDLVRRHYAGIRWPAPLPGTPEQHLLLERAARRVDRFHRAMQDPSALLRYTEAFNRLTGEWLWWQMVACERLEELWDV